MFKSHAGSASFRRINFQKTLQKIRQEKIDLLKLLPELRSESWKGRRVIRRLKKELILTVVANNIQNAENLLNFIVLKKQRSFQEDKSNDASHGPNVNCDGIFLVAQKKLGGSEENGLNILR